MPHLDRREWSVQPVPIAEARALVVAFHYARGASNTAIRLDGLYQRGWEGLAQGVAWWLPPTRVAAESVAQDWRGVLSLSRLVVAPGLPTNAASYLLGASIRELRREGRWHTLLTYADTGEGHTGAIYRATNWQHVGTMRGEPRYIDPSTGRHVARKAGRRSRTRAEMEELGYQWTPPTPKHKFILRLR